MASWHFDDAVTPRDLNSILANNTILYHILIQLVFHFFFFIIKEKNCVLRSFELAADETSMTKAW